MALYLAHYQSPPGEHPVSGVFEFESEHRVGSRQNMHDARMSMLRFYGNEAVAWNIDSIRSKRAKDVLGGHQMEIDFREPVQSRPKKRITRGFK